jgi:hypothetical protein
LLPDEEGFDQALKRWAVNAEKNASIVTLVTSAADVSATASSMQAYLIIRLNLLEKIISLSLYVEVVILPPGHLLLKGAS